LHSPLVYHIECGRGPTIGPKTRLFVERRNVHGLDVIENDEVQVFQQLGSNGRGKIRDFVGLGVSRQLKLVRKLNLHATTGESSREAGTTPQMTTDTYSVSIEVHKHAVLLRFPDIVVRKGGRRHPHDKRDGGLQILQQLQQNNGESGCNSVPQPEAPTNRRGQDGHIDVGPHKRKDERCDRFTHGSHAFDIRADQQHALFHQDTFQLHRVTRDEAGC
jgi:hypothetical protein